MAVLYNGGTAMITHKQMDYGVSFSLNGMNLARLMVLSTSGTAVFNWSAFFYDNTVSQHGTANVTTSTAKTLGTVSGLTKPQLDNCRAFVIYPTTGDVLYAEVGTPDGLGGGTVATSSPRILNLTEGWL